MSSSSSTSLPATKENLPSLADVLDFTSVEASKCCTKLGLPVAGSKKQRQVALIKHISAKQGEGNSEPIEEKLSLKDETTTFTFEWVFSKAELQECDEATKGTIVKSKKIVDKNGIKWQIKFYPKGNHKSKTQMTGVFLTPVNLGGTNVVTVHAEFAICHLESETAYKSEYKFQKGVRRGWSNFIKIPSVRASDCPICLEQVTEQLSTSCGHSFCARCVLKMLTDSARIKCPLCRRYVRRSDDLVHVRYSALESFTLKATVRTLQLDKDITAAATLGDVMAATQSLESKLAQLSQQMKERFDSIVPFVSGSKRNFSEMSTE